MVMACMVYKAAFVSLPLYISEFSKQPRTSPYRTKDSPTHRTDLQCSVLTLATSFLFRKPYYFGGIVHCAFRPVPGDRAQYHRDGISRVIRPSPMTTNSIQRKLVICCCCCREAICFHSHFSITVQQQLVATSQHPKHPS